MTVITTILGTDVIATSRTTINNNFANLNAGKIETTVLDTDTTLAANSDSKIATQKAVKAYVDAGGNVNASTTTKGIVEEATVAEIAAGTAAGATGARLFINPSSTVSISAGAGDVGKIPRLNSNGQLDSSIVKVFSTAGTGNAPATSSTQTITHGLGSMPKIIRIYGHGGSVGSTIGQPALISFGIYASNGNFCIYDNSVDTGPTGTDPAKDNTICISLKDKNSRTGTALINNVTTTSFDLVWTVSASMVATVYLWEAV